MKRIGEPGGSVETLEEPPGNLTSIQVAQQDTGKFERLSRAESATKRPVHLKRKCATFLYTTY